jgi:hypothetical protein
MKAGRNADSRMAGRLEGRRIPSKQRTAHRPGPKRKEGTGSRMAGRQEGSLASQVAHRTCPCKKNAIVSGLPALASASALSDQRQLSP